MKIAVVYQYIYPQNFGGGEKRLYEIFSRFPKNASIDWFVQYQENYADFEELKRFNIICSDEKKKNFQGRSVLEILKYCYFILKELDLKKYDVVHIGQMPFFHILALLVKSKITKISTPKSATICIDWWEYWGNYWFSKHGKWFGQIGIVVEKAILSLATHVIVISNKTQNDLSGKTTARIELIHNGVDLKKIQAATPAENKYDCVIFGRIEEWKNPLMGVQVFQQMLSFDPTLKLLIAGDGSYKKTIEEFINSQGLQENIHLYGRAEESQVFGLLKSCKVMLLFSKQEGGGSITLFEANACGLPVATAHFENGIDQELVTDQNGFFFKEHDLKNIAFRIYQELKSDDSLKELSSSSKNFVKKFDWDILSKQYFDFFEQTLKGIS